ncbi:MAG: NUDIX hydrolase [Clostridia bacterium]
MKIDKSQLYEKTINSKTIYEGKIINLKVDEIELCNKKTSTREWIEHNGGVCVIAIDDDENIYLVNQFRYPYKEIVTEVPAGKREGNEDPLACAKRELLEETGFKANEYKFLGEMYPSPGYVGEIIYIYLATGLEKSEQSLDEDEFLTVEKISLEKAVEDVLSGKIKDAKTQCAVLKTKLLIK